MSSSVLKAALFKTGIAACALLLSSGAALAQSVSLTAGPTTTILPDGQTVPMWGYSCSAPATGTASCAALNPNPNPIGGWSPVVITVPAGSLMINLTNTNTVPTSLVIVGQLGGGLGDVTERTTMTVPTPHPAQGTTWPGTQGGPSGDCDSEDTFCSPNQVARVRSFATEVAAGATKTLTWNNLRPGTYLIHSGTQPSIQHPMGLYGVLVVTDPSQLNYPGQTFDQDVPLLLSEIDPVQNAEVAQVVKNAGFSDETVWSGQVGACGDITKPATEHTCYPPAVNYSPLYFMINGVSFDRSNPGKSTQILSPGTAAAGRVLLRFVNAGLRMHVPSVVGANMTLLAEDGNKLPGVPKVQNSVFLAAGKTYDVTIEPKRAAGTLPQPYTAATYAIFDRALSLSTNNLRDGGMQAFISVAGGAAPASTSAVARADTYSLVAGNVLQVGIPAKGVIANDTGVYGVTLLTAPAGGSVSLSPDGTFTYTPGSGTTADSFSYCANGTVTGATCSTGITATVTLAACTGSCLGGAPTANLDSYTSNVASRLQIAPPGVLGNDSDPSGLPLKVDLASVVPGAGLTVGVNLDGSFTATVAAPGTYTFTYKAKNSQNSLSGNATVTLNFLSPSNLTVVVRDAKDPTQTIPDYRWIIEEDRTIYIDPTQETNNPSNPVRTVAVNFHTSHTPVVAQGCVGPISCESGQTMLDPAGTGMHLPAVCDIGNGKCRTDAAQRVAVSPSQVHLDPTKRYYISILPGDAADDPGHAMGGAQIAAGQTAPVDVFVRPTPLTPAKIAVFVFQDDNPLNGEHDGGGPVTTIAQNEKGLGGFNITLLDQAGGRGDAAGQLTYDEFGQPVTNALAGKRDPVTNLDACPISKSVPIGQIVTCPKYESDGVTESPLAGHAIIDNMYAGFYEVQVSPSADRMARGEEWLQTNTLDGTKAIEAFIKPGEPGYFQEFGPGGYHVAVGFANPAIINARKGFNGDGGSNLCSNNTGCTNTIRGQVTALRMSRTPDQRVYSSGTYDAYSFTQCYASLGSPDTEDFAFAKCDADGKFEFTGLPLGNFKVTVFDQWNDLLVDGLSTPVQASATNGDGSPNTSCTGTAPALTCFYEIAVTQWRTNLAGRIFIDENNNGLPDRDSAGNDLEAGLPLVPYNLRYRDGSYVGVNNTDLNGYAGFNEVFPFLNWLVVDMDNARYKLGGVHVVYDAGGPADGTTVVPGTSGNPVLCTSPLASARCGDSSIAAGIANTFESPTAHLPTLLRVPGARYCTNADCTGSGSFDPTSGQPGSTGRVDPGWASTQGWQGLLGNNNFVEFAMRRFLANENGGIRGHVLYTPTRPFDDPALLLQLAWAPGIPNVKLNLYQEISGPDGTTTLKLVDTTESTSWDDWAQGFRRNANGGLVNGTDGKPIPNMNCPGQETSSPFYFTLQNSPMGLDTATPPTPLSADSRFKCYDGWSMLSQVQPAPYNGMYKFPSVVAKSGPTGQLPATNETRYLQLDPKTYKTNCTICTPNPDDGTPMLPKGKYVVEVVVPPGYELVKEEDKNILLGEIYTGATPQQFGFGSIFILPDQAALNAHYNPNNTLQSTTNNGAVPRREGDTGSVEVFWPCVGEKRIVPDLIALFPGAEQAAPFAGATRPLCDRKEVMLGDQMTVLAKFYLHTSAHVAAHYTGTITNDFASEFDPFSPQFGEKFAVPNTPVGMRDFAGKEIARVYADQWGIYNGMNYSSYTVNPPSPSGYIPQMMIACMNDPGPILDTRVGSPTNGQMITDPFYNPAYSNFCYEIPFMPGQTQYLDTPVVPTMAFAAGYNLPDCEYPDTTPAIKSVTSSDGAGPWVSASGAGHTLAITALGDKSVLNHAYSGPRNTTAPYNQKFITRHYGFGNTAGTVTIGGVNATINSWGPTQIVVTVPTIPSALDPATGVGSTCGSSTGQTPYQRTSPTSLGASARCGQLVVTAANGKKSIDTVTVTVAGKPPTYVTPTSPSNGLFARNDVSPLQSAIDGAAPGDLIIVGPGTYRENLIMWKPVRLQGVGAESVTINGDAHPAGKLDAWRRQIVCLFGLDLEGRPVSTPPPGCPPEQFYRADRNNFEGILGWDATANGNLAQQLQEPTLMGAYEGAGITVLGKGVKYPTGTSLDEQFGVAIEGQFPDGTQYLTNGNNDCNGSGAGGFIAFNAQGNFRCNPARIDGVSVINSSQGGGGIFLHGWNHFMEVANNRVHGNHGTLSGGVTIGAGEFGAAYIVGGAVPIPFPVPGGSPDGLQLGYGSNVNVRLHHNAVTANASVGDALFSGVNSGAGGVTFCTGSDNYRFDYNWICGNLSTGDGGGVVHLGFTNDGTIAHNSILFNQTASPTIPTNGGGLAVLGASPDRTLPDGTECGTVTDADCPPGLPEGTGRNLVIDANLILGNSAESGTGGGVRLQLVNGDDVVAFPTTPDQWNGVTLINNIIANNVAGWDGAGVSLQDALKVNFINNTVMSNDTTASAGVLFNTLGAPFGSVPPPGCSPTSTPSATCPRTVTTSTDQAAGLVTMAHTSNLIGVLTPGTSVTCPALTATAAISSMSRNSGVLTVNTATAVTLSVGSTVTIVGSPAAYNGTYTVATVVSPTQFTVLLSGGGGPTATGTLTYRTGVPYQVASGTTATCKSVSLPVLSNNIFYRNRAFHIGVSQLNGTGLQNQQKVITLYPSLTQATTGFCAASGVADPAPTGDPINAGTPTRYWDIGVRGDTSPTNHGSTFMLQPMYSILTSTTGYTGAGLQAADPAVVRMYCNGSRLPPEGGGLAGGFNTSVGRSETTGLYPVFALNQITPAATVDEGNNWVNLSYGPLSSVNVTGGPLPNGTPINGDLANYSITPGSPAINVATTSGAPNHDFFGTTRPQGAGFDIGAVELVAAPAPIASVTPSPLAFGPRTTGTNTDLPLTLSNTGNAQLTGVTVGTFPAGFSRPSGAAGGTCGATLNAGATCTIIVRFSPTAVTGYSGTVSITGNVTVAGSPVSLSGTGVAPPPAPTLTSIVPASSTTAQRGTTITATLTGTNLTGATAVNVAGGGGVTVSGFTVVNATTITVNLALSNGGGANAGPRTITVTTPGGTSNSVTFTKG